MGKKRNFNRDYYTFKVDMPEAISEQEGPKIQKIREEELRLQLKRHPADCAMADSQLGIFH